MGTVKLNLPLVGLIAALGALIGCTQGQRKVQVASGDSKPEVRINLSAYGLPNDFFQPGADTKCANQIIGYRFVVWLDSDNVVVGFNTSPNCRPSSDLKVEGSARLIVFGANGDFRVKRDIPYPADGYGELVASGEAGPGPANTLLFRVQSVNLDMQGSRESKSGVLLFNTRLEEVGRVDRFLEQTTFVDHALVFQEGFTLSNVRTYSIFDNIPLVQTKRWEQHWPVDARDRKFGEHGTAFMVCQQELQDKKYVSTGIVYAGAKQRCKMIAEDDHGQVWSVSLPDGETASIIGLLGNGSVVGNVNIKGSNAGQLVIWNKGKPPESLRWIPDEYCGSLESAMPDMSRYAALASDNCNDVRGLLGVSGPETKYEEH